MSVCCPLECVSTYSQEQTLIVLVNLLESTIMLSKTIRFCSGWRYPQIQDKSSHTGGNIWLVKSCVMTKNYYDENILCLLRIVQVQLPALHCAKESSNSLIVQSYFSIG